MSNNIWDDFDKAIDTEAFAEDVKNSAESPVYKEVPMGEYEVRIQKLELVKSKSGKPMVSVWFKVVSEGEYKGCMIFMNQVVELPFQVHICNAFLRSLDSDADIVFKSYRQYGELLMDVFEQVHDSLEYHLKYGMNAKGYNTFEILEVYEN